MKRNGAIGLVLGLAAVVTAGGADAGARRFDLVPQWDEVRVLRNPHKGWVHHFYDNDHRNYPPRQPAELDAVPGLGLIYIRLAWSYFEPEEGRYDWHWIDDPVKTYASRGYRFSVRVTCKETGTEYATPEWVVRAGAKGAFFDNWGKRNWEPVWDDPVFFAKLEAFHAAFAARYDGAPWLEDVDTGSYGDWGEGHTGFSSGKPASVEAVKRHLGLYAKAYRKTPLVTGDDWLKWSRKPEEEKALLDEALRLGYSIRDDSILVHWWAEQCPKTFSIDRPSFFEAVWRKRPTTLELQHYHLMKKDGDWKGPDGSDAGAAMLRGAIGLAHPTWVGYHGWATEWLRENPHLARELANRIGYWFFPRYAECPMKVRAGGGGRIAIAWENRGVAPAYRRYRMELKLVSGGASSTLILADADCRRWKPGETVIEECTFGVPAAQPSGECEVRVGLFSDGHPVEIGLSEDSRDAGGFYRIGLVEVTAIELRR